MNILNKFSKLKTWQKIGIGIAILSIFKYLSMGSIITNVYAKEKFNREIVFYNENQQQVHPEIAQSGVYYSNYIDETDLESLYNGNYNPFTTYGWSSIKLEDGEILNSNSTTSDIKSSNTLIGTNDNGHFIYLFDLNSWQYDTLIPGEFERGSQYTFLFEFSKGSKLIYKRGSNYTKDDFELTGKIFSKAKYGGVESWTYNLEDIFDIESIDWITPNIGDDDTPYSFLKVVISTNDMFPNYSGRYYKLQNMKIEFKDSKNPVVGDYVNINGGYDYFIGSTSNTSNTFIINKFYLIKDLEVSIGEIDYSGKSGSLLNSTKYLTCDMLDIGCHLSNLVTGIKSITSNLIYSLRTLIQYIFVPNWNELNNNINRIKSTLASKWPDFQALFDYFDYCIERIQQMQAQTTIHFDGVTWPFDNSQTYIIPPFTYDFNTIINDPRIGPYYLLGRAVMEIGILILWTIWLLHWAVNFLHNNSSLN